MYVCHHRSFCERWWLENDHLQATVNCTASARDLGRQTLTPAGSLHIPQSCSRPARKHTQNQIEATVHNRTLPGERDRARSRPSGLPPRRRRRDSFRPPHRLRATAGRLPGPAGEMTRTTRALRTAHMMDQRRQVIIPRTQQTQQSGHKHGSLRKPDCVLFVGAMVARAARRGRA